MSAAELMADGTLCCQCGVFIDDAEAGYVGTCGYPRYCRRCGGEPALNGQRDDSKPSKRGKKGRRS